MERRLAAILAADVVGYTALMGDDEVGTLRRLTELREQVLEPLIAEHRGRIVKLMGDGLLVEFASVVDAVACAVAWQNGVAERESERDDNTRLQFRIGINLGDVIVQGDDIHGDGVNIAARLEGLAEPGDIYVSGDAYRQVRGKIDVEFEDRGEQEVKNVTEPVRVYRIGADHPIVATSSTTTKPLPLPSKPSIAVLPFTNMSGDPEQDYFADGLTGDVIAQLSRFRSLFVIGSTSSFVYKGQTPKVQDVGRELGVAYVVQGNVRKAGNRVRITVELVEVATSRQLWAERYDRELEDIFAVQDDVTNRIVSTLPGHIEDIDRRRAMDKRTEDLAAYDYVLLGEQAQREGTQESILRARTLFQQAIDRDPGSARAHGSLARSYLDEYWSDWTTSSKAAADEAFGWAQKAVALDELDNRARVNLAVAYFSGESNFEAAQVQFAKALELNPNDHDAHCLQGWCHMLAGEGEQAISCTDRAMRLSPFDIYECNLAQFVAHYTARRYEDALSALGRIPDPRYEINAFRAACFAQLGRDAEARRAIDTFMAEASEAIADWPGEDPQGWRRYWANGYPFQDAGNLEHLLDGFRKAGLPV